MNAVWVVALVILASSARADEVKPEVVASGLQRPVGLAFLPDGRLLVIEQYTGRVRVIKDGTLEKDPWAEVPGEVYTGHNESGLIGICVDPQFEKNGFVYVFATVRSTLQQVARWREDKGRGVEWTVIVDGLPAMGVNHNGGGIGFGPDGMLYVSVGENGRAPQDAQKLESLRGKVLRYQPDGSLPADNPFKDSPVYCYGLRNTYRFAFHPRTGELAGSENGPSRDDEVNLLQKGKNYGWPEVVGKKGKGKFEDPIATFTPCVSPTGIVWYTGDRYPGWKDAILVGDFNDGVVHLIRFKDGGRREAEESVAWEAPPYGLTDLAVGPDGLLYLTHFKGQLYRLVPR